MPTPARKEKMSSLDVAAVVRELRERLAGAILDNVYQEGELFVFKFRKGGRRELLVFHPRVALYLTKYEVATPPSPPPFCARLRRFVRGARVEGVEQVDADRVVVVKLASRRGEYELIFELVREGNLVLTDGEGKIVAVLRRKKMRDRELVPGAEYIPPPSGLDPLEASSGEVLRSLRELSGRKLKAALCRALNSPPEVVEEALRREGIDGEARVSEIEESALARILRAIREIFERVRRGEVEPVLALDESGEPVGPYPVRFEHLGVAEYKSFDSFCEALDEYFSRLLSEPGVSEGRERKRLERSLKQLEERVEEYSSRAEKLREVAMALSSKLPELERTLESLRSAESEPEAREVVRSVLEGAELLELDRISKKARLLVGGVDVLLELSDSAGRNVSRIFEEAKEYERKAERAREVASELRERLGREEGEKEERLAIVLEERREKEWYEKFRWFVSSDGFLVVGGRDSVQNEVLVKKYAREGDLVAHAEIYGGSMVLIKAGGREVPESTLKEACMFAAAYSRAWRQALYSVDVFWVRPEQLVKRSGLKRGEFAIKGAKNYLRSVPLCLAVGVGAGRGGPGLVYGPPKAVVARTCVYVLLLPGRMEKDRAAEVVARELEEMFYARRGTRIRIDREEIRRILPAGGIYVVERPEKVVASIDC